MKWLISIPLVLLSACSMTNNEHKTEAERAVQEAITKSDLRFLATQGRRTTFPGLDETADKVLIDHCGYRFLEGTGDVIKSAEDKVLRKEKVVYASEYNQLIKQHCKP